MPTQQEEKLQNEFMHFWDNLKKTVNIGDYSDEITNWWIKKISLAVAQKEKKIIEIINTVEVKENPPFSANSEIREKAKMINEYLMPVVKEAIINTLKGGKEN